MKVSKPALLDPTLDASELPFQVVTLVLSTNNYEASYHVPLLNKEILVLGPSIRLTDFPSSLGSIRGQLIVEPPSEVNSGSFSLGLYFSNGMKNAGQTFLLGDYDPAIPNKFAQQIVGFEPWKPGASGVVQFTFDQQFQVIAPTFQNTPDGYFWFGLMNNTGINGNYDDWCKPPVVWHGSLRFSVLLFKAHTIINL